MTDSNDSLRKAAILIATLDPRSAERLLAQMPAEQAQRVRRVVAQLGPIDSVEQETVVAQFVRVGPLVPQSQPAGIELEGSLAARLGLAASAGRHAAPDRKNEKAATTPATDESPFRFLHEAECDELAQMLAREHPQTVAVVLAHLPSDRAAELVAALEDDLRVEVLRRLAYL